MDDDRGLDVKGEPTDLNQTDVRDYRLDQLERRFDKFENNQASGFKDITRTMQQAVIGMATTAYVDRAVQETRDDITKQVAMNSKRLDKLEGNSDWIVKLVLAGVIAALMGLIGFKSIG